MFCVVYRFISMWTMVSSRPRSISRRVASLPVDYPDVAATGIGYKLYGIVILLFNNGGIYDGTV